MNTDFNISKSKYVTSIIKSLKIDVKIFAENLAKGENYEVTIHQWSTNLFNEGKSIDKAIAIIRERINKVIQNNFINDKRIIEDQIEFKKLERIITELESKEIYSNLGDEEKRHLKGKIKSFIETRLYDHRAIVNFVLKIIEHNKKNERTNQMTNSKNRSRFDNSRILIGVESCFYPHVSLLKPTTQSSY
ncbi:hypothetical protein [uncultured Aquimarina sp.]|uniref:hypothetical protein n=1 Tax=uncultured Aquimarina sp. TaxID=575652 RepID=UPI0026095929|nr:hypothetical protein [uncultured Aquimarina sp.]